MTDKKDIRDLLVPRYKVIADYPFSQWNIGNVIMQEHDLQVNLSSFPAIFKPLEWWEERNPEDFPEYVKGLKKVAKVAAIEDHGGEHLSILLEGEDVWRTIWMFLPATKEEYESFINHKQRES